MRIEIVRSDAEQPWFARAVSYNGREIWRTSETYSRKTGVRNAIAVFLQVAHPRMSVWWRKDQIYTEMPSNPPHIIDVRLVDERIT